MQMVHNPSRADIIAVRTILLHLLPLELVDTVLHAAEYYSHYTSSMPLQHSPLMVRDGRSPAVISPPLPHLGSILRVIIRTESHDQGWSSYPEDKGTFNNSWTWLDLAVLRSMFGSASTETHVVDWRIYTNIHASEAWQTTEVILDKSNDVVAALEPGDSLIVWAKARSVFLRFCGVDKIRFLNNHQGFPDG
jgi:hypothetical protein